jgi:hypothetical protein
MKVAQGMIDNGVLNARIESGRLSYSRKLGLIHLKL